jgi:hypothetical protein
MVEAEITCRANLSSPSFEAVVQRWVTRLEDVDSSIAWCAVLIEPHGRAGEIRVRIDVTVPDQHLRVSQEPRHAGDGEDAYVTISNAFRAVRQRLLATQPRTFRAAPLAVSSQHS